MNFLERALLTVSKGVPVIRLRPNSKAAMDSGWPQLATTDVETIKKWNEESPESNCGAVATPEGFWFWETDSADVAQRVFADTGKNLSDIPTFKVRSRPHRGHFYFKQNDASRAMGNVAQSYVQDQDWSARVHGAYVVSSGSLHPDTGLPYAPINDNPIIEAPQWLIDWLMSQKIQKLSAPNGVNGVDAPRNERGLVPHGAIHNYLLTQAGKLRAMGLGQEEIEPALLKIAYDNCQPPLDDEKIIKLAKSICNFPAGQSGSLTLNQVPESAAEPEEEIEFENIEYPVFPKWVMSGTSIYENFVKPYCAVNSRVDYFMWMPTAAMMLNYLGTKIKVPLKGWKPSIYLVLIGEKGRANKSSSIKDGMKFLEFAGVLQMYSKDTKNADGKTVVWEAGSPEGLGTDMQRINCKNAVLFYDELSSLVSKAGIEGSGMNSALLKMYESANFSNSIKAKKDAFSVAPDTYVATVVTATTDKKFTELWSKLAGEDTGLDDRFTFLLQPENLPETTIQEVVPYQLGALETRKLIDRAVNQGEFKFFDQTPFIETLKKYGTRAEIRAEKWALYFAMDMGLTEIDEDCVERGIALARYEAEVKKYLMTFEAKNDESNIQQSLMRLLKKSNGRLTYREVERKLSIGRYGTTLWNRAFFGLINSGYIVQEGRGAKGDPKCVRMIRDMDFNGD
jgi:Bifunctional DNA primase/polymerase, N-terminal